MSNLRYCHIEDDLLFATIAVAIAITTLSSTRPRKLLACLANILGMVRSTEPQGSKDSGVHVQRSIHAIFKSLFEIGEPCDTAFDPVDGVVLPPIELGAPLIILHHQELVERVRGSQSRCEEHGLARPLWESMHLDGSAKQCLKDVDECTHGNSNGMLTAIEGLEQVQCLYWSRELTTTSLEECSDGNLGLKRLDLMWDEHGLCRAIVKAMNFGDGTKKFLEAGGESSVGERAFDFVLVCCSPYDVSRIYETTFCEIAQEVLV